MSELVGRVSAKTFTAAGVLPYCINEGKVLFLLGKETFSRPGSPDVQVE